MQNNEDGTSMEIKIIKFGMTIGIIALAISIVIWRIEAGKCWRNTLHTNLAISMLLNHVFYLLFVESLRYYSEVYRPESDSLNALRPHPNEHLDFTNKNDENDHNDQNNDIPEKLLKQLETKDIFFQAYFTSNNKLLDGLCKTTNTLSLLFKITTFYWMLVEGLHIFVTFYFPFKRIRHWYYYCIGWVVPIVPIIIWTILKSAKQKKGDFCWASVAVRSSVIMTSTTSKTTHSSVSQELNDSNPDPTTPLGFWNNVDNVYKFPIMIAIVLNIIILCSICYMIKSKVKVGNKLSRQVKTLAASTASLMPLLGLQNVILPVVSTDIFGPKFLEFVECLNAFLFASTGFLVACIFCFFNKETRRVVARRVLRYKNDHPDCYIIANFIEVIVAYSCFTCSRPKNVSGYDQKEKTEANELMPPYDPPFIGRLSVPQENGPRNRRSLGADVSNRRFSAFSTNLRSSYGSLASRNCDEENHRNSILDSPNNSRISKQSITSRMRTFLKIPVTNLKRTANRHSVISMNPTLTTSFNGSRPTSAAKLHKIRSTISGQPSISLMVPEYGEGCSSRKSTLSTVDVSSSK